MTVSDSQKTSEKYLEVSPLLVSKYHKNSALAGRPQDPHPTAPMPKQLSARRSEQRSFPGSKLVRREFTYGLLSR